MFALALIFFQTALAQEALYREYPLLANSQGVVEVSPLLLGDGTLFEEVVNGAAHRSYSEFLAFLKGHEPRLFRNHVLMHHSQSLQQASPENPRAILFHRGTMLAFSEPDRAESLEVEVLGWDPAQGRFRAAELRFPTRDLPAVVHRDPPECAACHGREHKPVWLPYDFWPGVYGANISRTLYQSERRALNQFIDRAQTLSKNSVYSHLDFSLYKPGRLSTQAQAVEIFTEFVGQLNTHFEVRKMAEGRGIPASAAPLLAAISGYCVVPFQGSIDASQWNAWLDRFNGYLPSHLRVTEAEVRVRFSLHRDRRKQHKQRLLSRYQTFFAFDGPGDIGYLEDRLEREWALAAWREILFEKVGVETHLGFSPFELPDIFTLPLNGDILWSTLIATHPQLGRPAWVKEIQQSPLQYAGRLLEWAKVDCQKLSEESRVRLAQNPLSELQPLRSFAPLGRCAHCHTLGADPAAPPIPFDDPSRIGPWIQPSIERISSQGAGRMPPDQPLKPDEKHSLIEALNRLKQR
jgi:hypothetical protein